MTPITLILLFGGVAVLLAGVFGGGFSGKEKPAGADWFIGKPPRLFGPGEPLTGTEGQFACGLTRVVIWKVERRWAAWRVTLQSAETFSVTGWYRKLGDPQLHFEPTQEAALAWTEEARVACLTVAGTDVGLQSSMYPNIKRGGY